MAKLTRGLMLGLIVIITGCVEPAPSADSRLESKPLEIGESVAIKNGDYVRFTVIEINGKKAKLIKVKERVATYGERPKVDIEIIDVDIKALAIINNPRHPITRPSE